MSSHVLPEVERVCDRLALLRQGRLVLVSTIEDVRRMAARVVHVVFSADVSPPAPWPDGVEAVSVTPRDWRLRVRGPLGALMAVLGTLPLHDVDVHEPHLEDVLRRYYADAEGDR